MNYQETISYLYQKLPMYQNQGKSAFKKDLNNIKILLDRLNNPQIQFPSIHIAGTNGKGTVSHIIAAGIQNNGKKVGIYTSPHYKDFRERIKINGELISEQEVIQFVEDIKEDIELIQPSFFEITVALAFYYFAKQKVDIAIIETGLGGRLDSTNIIMPILSIITNISHDHQSMLGDSVRQIAREKAGIIKYSVPVIIGEYQSNVQDIFDRKALDSNSALFIADRNGRLQRSNNSENTFDFHVAHNVVYEGFTIDYPNEFLLRNFHTALYSLFYLSKTLDLDDSLSIKGVEQFKELTYFIGRYQILQESPKVIVDSAHNVAGIKLLFEEVNKADVDQLHIIIGMVDDKDHDKILRLLPDKARYYAAKANVQRGLDAEILNQRLKANNLYSKAYASVQEAYQDALSNAQSQDLVLVTGSIFVVAEVL